MYLLTMTRTLKLLVILHVSWRIWLSKLNTDEDITILDAHTPWPSPSYRSSSTRSPRLVRIQPTPLHSFGTISLIRYQNEVFFDVLERGRPRHHFGSSARSRTFVDHAVWPRQGATSPVWAKWALYHVGP